jgi:hypothetical protein
MKKLMKILFWYLLADALVLGFAGFIPGMVGEAAAQTALTQTTLSAAVTSAGATTVTVASATGINAPAAPVGPAYGAFTQTELYVDQEAMLVTSLNGKNIGVVRGANSTQAATHGSGAVVWIGTPTQFFALPPNGSCTAANTVSPYIDTINGQFWLCDSVSGNWLNVFSTGAITPVATGATIGTLSTQTFTVTGLITGEPILVAQQPAPNGLCPLLAARVTAANTVSLYWAPITAVACTPSAGTYMFLSPRFNVAF